MLNFNGNYKCRIRNMKRHKLLFFVALLIFTFNGLFAQDSSDQEKIEMLKNFYKEYTAELESIDVNWEKVDSIEKRYCTERLLNWRKSEELDYDPFINAQDLNPGLYEILNIRRDNSRQNKFVVTYNYFEIEPENESKIELIVIRSGGKYKIDQILIE